MMDNAGITKIVYNLGEILRLYNCAVADKGSIDEHHRELGKAGLRKSHRTLGDIVGLHNCAVADITPQLWHDVTLQQRLKSLGKAGIAKIAYDFRRDLTTAQLCSCKTKDQLMMDNAGITKIAYNLRRDLTTAQLCSCRQRIN